MPPIINYFKCDISFFGRALLNNTFEDVTPWSNNIIIITFIIGRCSSLVVSALDSRLTLGLSPGRGHWDVSELGKTLDCLSASLHPGV